MTSNAPTPKGTKSPLCGSSATESERSIPRKILFPSAQSAKGPPYVERVDGACVRGSRGPEHEPWDPARPLVLRHRTVQLVRDHAVALIDRDPAHDAVSDSRDPETLGHAVVRLLRQVDDRALDVPRLETRGLARDHDCAQVRHAPAGEEVPHRGLRVAHDGAEPAKHLVLDADRSGSSEDMTREPVRDGGEEFAEVSEIEIADGDEGEETRRRGVLATAIHVAREKRQRAVHSDGIAADRSSRERLGRSLVGVVRGCGVHPREERLRVRGRSVRQCGAFGRRGFEWTRERFEGAKPFEDRVGHGRGI